MTRRLGVLLAATFFAAFQLGAARADEPIGVFREKYERLGGADGPLGPATGIEAPTPDWRGGKFHTFKYGIIYWHPDIGEPFAVWGEIALEYSRLGSVDFGYPVTDEWPTLDARGGRFNRFRSIHLPGKPESSIYWTPQTGAHAVSGVFHEGWAKLRWEQGELGYPTGDEFQDGKYRRINFERGHMVWAQDTGAIAYLYDGTAWIVVPPNTAPDNAPEKATDSNPPKKRSDEIENRLLRTWIAGASRRHRADVFDLNQ